MKKVMIVALVLAVGLAVGAQVFASDVKAKESVKTTANKEVTKTEIKGDNVKMKTEEIDKLDKSYGTAKFNAKEGAIEDLNIKWVYYMKDNNYITEYTLLEKTNKKLMQELNLTPVQAALLKPGKNKIISTSPYTGDDIRTNIRAVILKDIQMAATQQ